MIILFKLKRLSIIIFIIFLFSTFMISQQIDEARIKSSVYQHLPLRWDNIETIPGKDKKNILKYNSLFNLHLLSLDPGQLIKLELPTQETLRIMSLKNQISREDIDITISNGSGLHSYVKALLSDDKHSLLVSHHLGHPSIIHLKRPMSSKKPLLISLFFSRHDMPKEILSYRKLSKIPSKLFSLKRFEQAYAENYYLWEKNKKKTIELTGPGRLEFHTRMKYEQSDKKLRQSYWMWIVDKKLMEFHTVLETLRPVKVNGKDQQIGVMRSAWIDIPKGRNTLEIIPSADIYIQIKTLLLPAGLLKKNNTGDNFREIKALKLIKKNNLRDAQMAGLMQIKELSDLSPGDYQISKIAKGLYFHHSYYRHLLPDIFSKNSIKSPIFLHYNLKHLMEKNEKKYIYQAPTRFLDDLQKQRGKGFFFKVSNKKGLVYLLPKRSTSSILRIVVDRYAMKEPVNLLLQYDKRKPIKLRVFPKQDLSEIRYDQSGLSDEENIKTAYVEMHLPANVKKIRILSEKHLNKFLSVSMSYRSSRQWQLSANQINFASNFALSKGMINNILKPMVNQHNHPFNMMLNSRNAAFSKNIGKNINRQEQGSGTISLKKNNILISRARRNESENFFIKALEDWNNLLYLGMIEHREIALWGRIRALTGLNEYFQIEQLLKSIVLWEKDLLLIKKAVNFLEKIYQNNGKTGKLQNLWAVLTTLFNDKNYYQKLLDDWLTEERPDKLWNQITDSAGARSLYNRSRNLYSLYFYSTQENPLTLEINGPVDIKIESRLFHPVLQANKVIPKDRWMVVEINGKKKYFPVNLNLPSTDFDIIGYPELLPGHSDSTFVHIKEGKHKIKIYTMGEASLVSLIRLKGNSIESKSIRNNKEKIIFFRMVKLILNLETQIKEVSSGIENTSSLGIIAEAALLYTQNRNIPGLYSLYRRLKRITSWERVLPDKSAGLVMVEKVSTDLQSPYSRMQNALLPIRDPEDILINNTRILNLELNYLKPRRLKIRFNKLIPDYLQMHPVKIICSLDGSKIEKNIINMKETTASISFDLPIGRNVLTISMSEADQGQFINIRFWEIEKSNDLLKIKKQKKRLTFEAKKIFYHKAAKNDPLHLGIKGPLWMRLDTWKNNQLFQKNMFIFDKCEIKISKSGTYRVYTRILTKGKSRKTYKLFTKMAACLPFQDLISDKSQQTIISLKDQIRPAGQEDGTNSLEIGYNSFRPILEEWLKNDDPDHFMFFTFNHRYFNAQKHRYGRTELLTRIRDVGGHTIGIRNWLYYRPRIPFNLDLHAALLGQKSEYSILNKANKWNIAAKFQLRLGYRWFWNKDTINIPAVRLFGRVSNVDLLNNYEYIELDRDIYSSYKGNHRSGISIEDRLSVRLRENTGIWFRMGLTSNENLNLLHPDYVTASTGFKHRFYKWLFEADYQWIHYFKDEDRKFEQSYYRISAGLEFEHIQYNWKRWQLSGKMTYDLGMREVGFTISLKFHLGKWRGYRDFGSFELDFKNIRERDSLIKKRANNE